MKKYELILFDFDGTLADSIPWLVKAINGVAEKYKFRQLTLKEFTELRGRSPHEVMKYMQVAWWKVPLIARHMRQLAAQNIRQIQLFEGMDIILAQLSAADVRLGVVSSNSEENVRHVLGDALANVVEFYECSVPILRKRARFERIVRKANLEREKILCVGDEIRDAEAAKQAQLAFGAVGWGMSRIQDFAPYAPREVFFQVSDIATRLID
ncbi:HAD-IA family hydrolase [Herpetosiphon geysericola]|uniref:HAD family hydrolase n=1 Tax=Herpetosiphon geysericola TaxID=70996 RepID=A0A0P6YNX4_9CHLR|nr:HAD-IA family hydrolase [Herpetosiphon geysericola]KPL92001.1 hypothetical protein SE18_00140 [Herpetosiphon geysericola]